LDFDVNAEATPKKHADRKPIHAADKEYMTCSDNGNL